jgi:hypothetical protein
MGYGIMGSWDTGYRAAARAAAARAVVARAAAERVVVVVARGVIRDNGIRGAG